MSAETSHHGTRTVCMSSRWVGTALAETPHGVESTSSSSATHPGTDSASRIELLREALEDASAAVREHALKGGRSLPGTRRSWRPRPRMGRWPTRFNLPR